MEKYITSKILGKLNQVENLSDWWKIEEVSIPLFGGQKLPIIFMDFEPEHDSEFINEADQALSEFLKLDVEYRESISELAYQNCKEFLDLVDFDEEDEPLRRIRNTNEIWNFIFPTEIYLSRRPYIEHSIYVQVVCECDWEQEHGLQLVFKQGKKLTRISDQDGHLTEADAYGKSDIEDFSLNEFNQKQNIFKKSWWKFW